MPCTPDESLELLRQGNNRFVNSEIIAPNRDNERIREIATGQNHLLRF